MYDIAIIGTGVIGALAARELTRYNLSVCLLEKASDVSHGATKANSGIVHAGFDAKPGTKKALFNVRGAALMPELCAELGVKYRQNGSLVVAFTQEEMEILHELMKRGQQNGVQNLFVLDKDQLFNLEPNLSPDIIGALHAPDAGIVSPYKLAIAAVGCAMDNGADLRLNFEVKDISIEEDHFVVSSENDQIQAKYIINAARNICRLYFLYGRC